MLSILILETQKNYHKSNVSKYWPSGGEVFGTKSNIYDGTFCENSSGWKPLPKFSQKSILNIWLGSECDWMDEWPSQSIMEKLK